MNSPAASQSRDGNLRYFFLFSVALNLVLSGFLISCLTSIPQLKFPEISRKIVIGSFRQSFHEIESAGVQHVLQSRGYEAERRVVFAYSELFDALFNGTLDLLPSVWIPDGHAAYLEGAGRLAGKDYVIVGQSSEVGAFFWIASPAAVAAGIGSIDDLANPSNTLNGFEMQVVMSAAMDTGLSKASVSIIDALNARRMAVDPNASLFSYDPDFNEVRMNVCM